MSVWSIVSVSIIPWWCSISSVLWKKKSIIQYDYRKLNQYGTLLFTIHSHELEVYVEFCFLAHISRAHLFLFN